MQCAEKYQVLHAARAEKNGEADRAMRVPPLRGVQRMVAIAAGSDVEILHIERIVFDELASALDVFAHQRGEDLFGLHQVFEADRE